MRRERVHDLLSWVGSNRERLDLSVGLRDGAVLALLAAGLTPEEISRLRASAVSMYRNKLLVAVHRQGVTWYAVLPPDLGGHVMVWLTESRLWAEAVPAFPGPRGPISPATIYSILKRYRQQRKAPRC